MKGIPNTERQRLGALLDHETQETVMAMIPQFSETEIGAPVPAPAEVPEELGLLVFNMERGVHLEELGDFLQDCPGVRPLDVVLANELDDGCVRSGGRNTARELAERFGWNYAYGLEFIELVNGEDPKGFHGNAVFSRWPIRRAWTLRLPEQYNWYFDRQRRIGGRCAVMAELDVGGRPLGVASIHLENRTHGEGRRLQLEAVLRAAEKLLPGIPVVLGGDLNTNTFDGRDKDAIREIAGSPALQRRCLEDVAQYEAALTAAEAKAFGVLGNRVFLKLENLTKPTIAAVNGFALGGGCELAMSCDIILAAGPNAEGKGGAKFGQPEVGLGITPGFSGTQRLPRRVGIAKAKELIFSGKVIGAAEAEKIGLVNAVYAPEELIPGAIAMAKSFTANAPIAVKYSKACIDRGMQMDIDDGIALENELFAMCFATADQKEGMSAFVEKRKEKHFQNK